MHTTNSSRIVALVLAALPLGPLPAAGQESPAPSFPDQFQDGWEQAGPNVRIKRHQDGSRTVFQRSPDDRTLVKRTFGEQGNLKMVAVYRVDGSGNPLSCKIFDGSKNVLYKVSYGYDKHTGRLEAERMFDARVQRLDPNNPAQETPIRVMYYNYDAQGNTTAPEVYTFNKGMSAEDVFGPKGTFPHENPFQ
jgi:hypothetical protein